MYYELKLYDKDNDVYMTIYRTKSLVSINRFLPIVDKLVKKDMIVRHCSDGTKEPFDMWLIDKVSEGANNEQQ